MWISLITEEISRVEKCRELEDDDIEVVMLEYVSPIEWDNVMLWAIRIGPRSGPLTRGLRAYFYSNLGGTLIRDKITLSEVIERYLSSVAHALPSAQVAQARA